MISACSRLPFSKTNAFTKLVNDYTDNPELLSPFYQHPVSEAGLKAAIEARKGFDTPRALLQQALTEQYAGIELTALQNEYLQALGEDNCFTFVTAHQPNLFTGPLYFLYKILHAIKLADTYNAKWPTYKFVPVYYMGSEDADLDELNHFFIGSNKITWDTQQVGAVGRMHTKGIAPIIERLNGEFGFLPHGEEIIRLLNQAYLGQPNIQLATLHFVNALFAEFGLLILIPDSALLKSAFASVIKKELTEQFSAKLVAETIEELGKQYKVQAAGRDINLFYLMDDGRRERIEKVGESFQVLDTDLSFTETEMLKEVDDHPERFSPNVILRGAFQETILPNIAFIGGGGELAYWLELKGVFEALSIPYPMLILRNSFLLVNEEADRLSQKLELQTEDLFLDLQSQQNLLIEKRHGQLPDTQKAQQSLQEFYEILQQQAFTVDPTLKTHVAALHAKAHKGLVNLEKKLQRAERRKLTDETRQLEKLKSLLFPNGSLQERIENVVPYYALYGKELLRMLYEHSPALEQEFSVVRIKK